MNPLWSSWLVALALLSSGVVYGTDVFFALIARSALRRVDEASLTQVMGHLHAVADARMPLFGATALLSTGGLFLAAGGWPTLPGRLALLALAGLLTQLAAYLLVAQPVNQCQTAAARQHHTPTDARALQDRWDRVIGLRAGALTVAMAALIAVTLHFASLSPLAPQVVSPRAGQQNSAPKADAVGRAQHLVRERQKLVFQAAELILPQMNAEKHLHFPARAQANQGVIYGTSSLQHQLVQVVSERFFA